MNTTEIFIEHLIAGVQVGIWILLVLLNMFGVGWLDFEKIEGFQIIIAVLLLPFIYPLGVLVDNLIDELLQPIQDKIRAKYIGKDKKTAVLMLKLNNSYVNTQLDYIRRRIRISRSSFFNLILITFFGLLFVITRGEDVFGDENIKVGIFLGITGIIFSYLAYNAWHDFVATQYKRVRDLYEII